MKHDGLAIIIPAFNEEPRIERVLDVVCSYPGNNNIVVIDDGSDDLTGEKAKKFPVHLISYRDNKGKGAALQAGINFVEKAPFWLFLDADLINLQHYHLDALREPLTKEGCQMTIGVFRDGDKHIDFVHRHFGILNGQRGFTGNFIADVPDLCWSRFGVEIFLSKLADYRRLPVAHPYLKGLSHHMKESKYGPIPGFYARLKMYKECIYSLSCWKKYAN